MSRLLRNKKLVGGTSNNARSILYTRTGQANTNVGAELDQINASLTENLNDISLRYNTTSSRPEWKERGADTWNPFNTTPNYIIGQCASYYSYPGGSFSCANADGTYYMHSRYDTNWRDSLTHSDLVKSYTVDQYNRTHITLAKTGYYQTTNESYGGQQTIQHYDEDDSVQFTGGYSVTCLIYLGETNPFA